MFPVVSNGQSHSSRASESLSLNIEDIPDEGYDQSQREISSQLDVNQRAHFPESSSRTDPSASEESAIEETMRTRRLLSRFYLWRTGSEMTQRSTNQRIDEHNVRINLNSNVTSLMARQTPTTHSQISFSVPGIGFAGAETAIFDRDQISGRKLCQTLVFPLIIGTIIFMVAIWTRQLSLALYSDSMVMVMILAAFFILMSGVAFWLSYDQELDEVINMDRHEHRHDCPHRHSPDVRWPNHLMNNSVGQDTHRARGVKSTTISIIDCPPPDYYHAIRYSMPVDCDDLRNSNNKSRFSLDPDSLPPQYEDVETGDYWGPCTSR